MPPSPPGRLSTILGPWRLVSPGLPLQWDAFKEVYGKHGLGVLFRLKEVRDIGVAKLLSVTSEGFTAYENTTSVPSLVRASTGRILELGPGPGNQIHRYDPSLVDFIYAIDPNPGFEEQISYKLVSVQPQLQDRYKFIACGIEDSDVLRSAGVAEGCMDTVTSIQVLCAVDDPKVVMKEVYKLLKPGGKFIFWEHGKSKNTLTAIIQRVWNPAWWRFVGCSMTRDVRADILGAGEWENANEIKEANDPYTCLPRLEGILIKKA